MTKEVDKPSLGHLDRLQLAILPQQPESQLIARKIVLPVADPDGLDPSKVVIADSLMFVSSAPTDTGIQGILGKEITTAQGYTATREVGIAMLARVRSSLGSLNRVKRVVKVFALLNSSEDFSDHPKILDGMSDLLVEIFGKPAGGHARSAIGVQPRPGTPTFEIELVLEIYPPASQLLG
jgi:enamine deaminase RidA (YjgF/YER057c/UK114 family)